MIDLELVDPYNFFRVPGPINPLPNLLELLDGVATLFPSVLGSYVAETLPVGPSYQDTNIGPIIPAALNSVDPSDLAGMRMASSGHHLLSPENLLNVLLREDQGWFSLLRSISSHSSLVGGFSSLRPR